MDTQRKKELEKKRCIECDGVMKLTILKEEGISCQGYKCTKCGHTIVTLDQMRLYNKIRDFEKAVPQKRRIVKIGNSLGFTLPYVLKEYGLEVGKEIEIKIVDSKNLYLRIV